MAARVADAQVAQLQLEGQRRAALAAGSRLLAERGHRWGDLLTILLDDIEQAVADRRAA